MAYEDITALRSKVDRLREPFKGGLIQILRDRKANKLDEQLIQKERQNDQNRQREMAELLRGLETGVTGGPGMGMGALKTTPVNQYAPTDPEVRALAEQLRLDRATKAAEEYTLSPGAQRYRGSDVIAQAPFKPEDPNFNQPFNPDGTPNLPYQQYMEGLRPTTSTTVNLPGAQNAYLSGRAGEQAKDMGELEAAATSAYTANQALDRFVQSSSAGDAGAAQPIITGVKNFLASFGIDPEGLTDTTVMQQAIGQILGAKMSELGARGLTDRDMEVLRQALPQVSASHEARVQVADILKRANETTIQEYRRQADFEQQQYPDYKFMRPSWFGNEGGLSNDERAELEALRAEFRGR